MKQEMLSKLHSTHISEKGMKKIERVKLRWYNMSEDI